jgi:hypothetical protein
MSLILDARHRRGKARFGKTRYFCHHERPERQRCASNEEKHKTVAALVSVGRLEM